MGANGMNQEELMEYAAEKKEAEQISDDIMTALRTGVSGLKSFGNSLEKIQALVKEIYEEVI